MSTRESRPKAAHEVPAKGPIDSVAESALTFEDRHSAWLAGFDLGYAQRVEAESEDLARALLLAWSRESRDMATEYASRVGPNWAAMVAGDLDER